MQANELRIGSRVDYRIGNNAIKIEAKDLLEFEKKEKSIIDKIYLLIPLTGDRLLEFGIKKINNSMFRMGSLTFQFYTDMSLEAMQNMNLREGFRVCLNGRFICNLFGVHELQNLYFALTGNELFYKKIT